MRFFTDEDVYGAIAPALRKQGVDSISSPEAGRLGISDEEQLTWAAQEKRVMVTFNVAHFARLHEQWTQTGRNHAGIIVSTQRPIGDVLRRLLNLAKAIDGDTIQNRLEFLSDW